MRRILIAVEDYSELVFLETLFKKVGLDVEGVQNDTAVPEKLLGFSPDMVILSTYGTRVSPAKLLPKIKRKVGYPKIVLLFQKARPGAEKELKTLVDAMLESPIHPRFLLEATEKLLSIESGLLMRKMERIDTVDRDEKLQHIKGDGGKVVQFPLKGGKTESPPKIPISEYRNRSELSDDQKNRKKHRYQAWVESEHLPPFQGLTHDRVAAIEKEWRKTESDPEIVSLDEERKAFVTALFAEQPKSGPRGKERNDASKTKKSDKD